MPRGYHSEDFEIKREERKRNWKLIATVLILLGLAIVIPVVGNTLVKNAEQPYYAPGETLNPSCSTQDPRCGVRQ